MKNTLMRWRRTLLAVLFCLLSAVSCAENKTEEAPQDVMIGGVAYPRDTAVFTVSDADFTDYAALRQFPQLTLLDLTGLTLTAGEESRIAADVGNAVTILWNVPLRGGYLRSDISELTISEPLTEEDIENLYGFTSLKKATVENYPLSEELLILLSNLRESNPNCDIAVSSSVYDVPVDNQMDTLILNRHRISSTDDLKQAIRIFPNIKNIEMCRCGLSNETMGKLREDYPEINFVWEINVLIYTLRTDAQSFSTLVVGGEPRGTEKDFAPLFTYCTELRALDLGHQELEDISAIANLTKLQTLILADNHIKDITPLAQLKDLNYLEIFENSVKDFTPLLALENLEDLNMMYNHHVTEPTCLLGCKKLRRLYVSGCNMTKEDKNTLREGLPEGCEFNTTASNCVHDGWREDEKNEAVRKAFKYWRKVKEYRRWDDVVYN